MIQLVEVCFNQRMWKLISEETISKGMYMLPTPTLLIWDQLNNLVLQGNVKQAVVESNISPNYQVNVYCLLVPGNFSLCH